MQGTDEIEPSKETSDLGMPTPLAAFDQVVSTLQEMQNRVRSFADAALGEGAVVFNDELAPTYVGVTWPNDYKVSMVLGMRSVTMAVSDSRTGAVSEPVEVNCESLEAALEAALEGRH